MLGKSGFVYFIEAPDVNRIKIGSTNSIPSMHERLRALRTASPIPLVPLGYHAGGESVERRLHHRFAHLRVIGEYFAGTPELRGYIREKAKPWPVRRPSPILADMEERREMERWNEEHLPITEAACHELWGRLCRHPGVHCPGSDLDEMHLIVAYELHRYVKRGWAAGELALLIGSDFETAACLMAVAVTWGGKLRPNRPARKRPPAMMPLKRRAFYRRKVRTYPPRPAIPCLA